MFLATMLDAATYGSNDRIIAIVTLIIVAILLALALFSAYGRRP
jgi:hypothetical protein